jgi:hypothetical protein
MLISSPTTANAPLKINFEPALIVAAALSIFGRLRLRIPFTVSVFAQRLHQRILSPDLPNSTHEKSCTGQMRDPESGLAALPRFWENPAVLEATPQRKSA